MCANGVVRALDLKALGFWRHANDVAELLISAAAIGVKALPRRVSKKNHNLQTFLFCKRSTDYSELS